MTRIATISACLLLALATASAQTDTGEAEQLFRTGKKLMDEGNIAEACTAFEGSYRKDPAISTLLNLANCREKNHQYASAWGLFIDAARKTRNNPDQANFNTTANHRVEELEPRLSYLIISVPNESQVDGLTITRNGEAVDPAEWNRDVPVDGGEYKIEAKAPGYEAWSTTVRVAEAKDKQSVNVPKFHEAAVATTTHHRSMTGKRKVAIGAWTAGGVALGGAVFLELSGRNTYDDAKAATDNPTRHQLYDSANQKHTLAAISAGVAVVAVGAGVLLWVTGKPRERAAVAVAPYMTDRSAGLVIGGSF